MTLKLPQPPPHNTRRSHPSHIGSSGHWPTTDGQHRSSSDSSVILLESSMARISDQELQIMSREDLMDVARMATSSLPQQEFLSHLPYMNREQLRQLVCLARHSCRLQTGLTRDCR